jgi:predicted ATPase
MVHINHIQEPVVPLYGPEGLIGYIKNQLEFADVRGQIKTQRLQGYYFIFNDERIDIDEYGNCSKWPKGFYDQIDDLLTVVVGF